MLGGRGLSAAALALCFLATLPLTVVWHRGDSADEALTDPFLGQPDAIAAGKDIYRSKCYVCHHSAGGRGPNLFASKVSDERFLETVINGRKGTQMPAFGLRLSPDEVWQVHAFIRSTDHY
jgi:mono/diheme cytochrome c family protein